MPIGVHPGGYQRVHVHHPPASLQSLERRGPSMVTELGNDLDMLVSTASRLSDRLADAGLITRRVSPNNRRATLLELTDAGRDVLDELVAIRTSALAAVADRMTAQQRAALLDGAAAFTATHERLPDSVQEGLDQTRQT